MILLQMEVLGEEEVRCKFHCHRILRSGEPGAAYMNIVLLDPGRLVLEAAIGVVPWREMQRPVLLPALGKTTRSWQRLVKLRGTLLLLLRRKNSGLPHPTPRVALPGASGATPRRRFLSLL